MKTKIKPEHVAHIRKEIERVLSKYPDSVSAYEHGRFPRADRVKDLQRRFCFDLMYAAGLLPFVVEHIYPYANDDHIYTVLRQVCPVVTRKYSIKVSDEKVQADH